MLFLFGLNIAVVADGGKIMPYSLMYFVSVIGGLVATACSAR